MKCAECKNEITVVFLDKIKGTYIRRDGKKAAICSDCQKNLS